MGVRREQGEYFHTVRTEAGEELAMSCLHRTVHDRYRLEFNEFRQIRPVNRNTTDVSECGFGCQASPVEALQNTHSLSLLNRPVLFSHTSRHGRWAGFANGSIIEPAGHFLLVHHTNDVGTPEFSLPHEPQTMTREVLEDLVQIHTHYKAGFLAFYNHLQAGGSQNHLHLQLVARRYCYPLESARVVEFDPLKRIVDYPAHGSAVPLSATEWLWEQISQLEERSVPYNLVLILSRAYLFVRPRPASVENRLRGRLACLELAGRFILSDYSIFCHANLDDIEHTLLHETCAWSGADDA